MVTKDAVRTFDTVSFPMPMLNKTCAEVLAMDCSDEKTFAVTMTPTGVLEGQRVSGHLTGDMYIVYLNGDSGLDKNTQLKSSNLSN